MNNSIAAGRADLFLDGAFLADHDGAIRRVGDRVTAALLENRVILLIPNYREYAEIERREVAAVRGLKRVDRIGFHAHRRGFYRVVFLKWRDERVRGRFAVELGVERIR